MTTIAIIGAGIAGLSLANLLKQQATITLFEKARGPGGRMSTRYADPYQFDHGAQYFTVREDSFRDFLAPYIERGTVQRWHEPLVALSPGQHPQPLPDETRYVAAPKMNQLTKELAQNVLMHRQTHIHQCLHQDDQRWMLEDTEGNRFGPFNWIISTAPPVQTAAVLPEIFALRQTLDQAVMQGCFTLMVGYDIPPTMAWAGAKVSDSPIGWLALNHRKPGRDHAPSVVIQSTNDWADKRLEESADTVEDELLNALQYLLPDLPTPAHSALHRWRYAAVQTPISAPFLLDDHQQLAACGDWCIGERVEAAFLSAYALAESLRSIL